MSSKLIKEVEEADKPKLKLRKPPQKAELKNEPFHLVQLKPVAKGKKEMPNKGEITDEAKVRS